MSYGGGFLLPPPTFPSSYIFIGKHRGNDTLYGGVASRQRCFVDVTRGRNSNGEADGVSGIGYSRVVSSIARVMKLHGFVRMVDIIGEKSESKYGRARIYTGKDKTRIRL